MKIKSLITMLAVAGFAAAAQAGTVSIDFTSLGSGDLGAGPKTFTSGSVSLTAAGFSGPSTPIDLYSKQTLGDPVETGLGLNNGGTHEITPGSFIQLSVPPVGGTLTLVMVGSIQDPLESVAVTFGTANGVLGVIPINGQVGGLTASFTIPAIPPGANYVDITAPNGDVLLDAAVITTPTVPDGGMTIALLGGAITALGFARRKLIA